MLAIDKEIKKLIDRQKRYERFVSIVRMLMNKDMNLTAIAAAVGTHQSRLSLICNSEGAISPTKQQYKELVRLAKRKRVINE